MTALPPLLLAALLGTLSPAVAQDALPSATTAPAAAGAPDATQPPPPPSEDGGATLPPSGTPPGASGAPTAGIGDASGPPPLGNAPGVGDPGAEPNGVPPTDGGAAASNRPSAASFPSDSTDSDSSSASWFMALGAALFLLFGVGWLRTQGSRDDAQPLPSAVTRLPEPPFVSSPLPTLSDGLQLWLSDEDVQPDLIAAVLATLARHHRVLVVCSADVDLPRVAGGPVFRIDGLRPTHLEEPAHLMEEDGGRAVAVLVLAPAGTESAAAEFADVLPAQVGGVVLTAADVDLPLPTVEVRRTSSSGWALSCARGSVTVVTDARGVLARSGDANE